MNKRKLYKKEQKKKKRQTKKKKTICVSAGILSPDIGCF